MNLMLPELFGSIHCFFEPWSPKTKIKRSKSRSLGFVIVKLKAGHKRVKRLQTCKLRQRGCESRRIRSKIKIVLFHWSIVKQAFQLKKKQE